MRQRPVACLALLVFLILQLIPPGFFYEPRAVTEKCDAQVTGRVSRRTDKDDKTQLYLENCQVEWESGRCEAGRMLI